MTFYITKWALTNGVEVVDLRVTGREDGETRYATNAAGVNYGGRHYFCRVGSDAFETLDEARADVVKRAKAKLKSIEKQTAKLHALIKEHS